MIILKFDLYSQRIDYYDAKLDCDTAYTTLELGWCSKYSLEQSVATYDSLIFKFNLCLDTLIAEDDRFRKDMLKDDPNTKFDYWTDYRKIKSMLKQSDKIFREYAAIESDITGEFYGLGRERSIGVNMRMKEIFDKRIEELKGMIKYYCG